MEMNDKESEICALEQRIAELQARLPKHSPPPAMLIELDELEDALERLQAEVSSTAPGEPKGTGCCP